MFSNRLKVCGINSFSSELMYLCLNMQNNNPFLNLKLAPNVFGEGIIAMTTSDL